MAHIAVTKFAMNGQVGFKYGLWCAVNASADSWPDCILQSTCCMQSMGQGDGDVVTWVTRLGKEREDVVGQKVQMVP